MFLNDLALSATDIADRRAIGKIGSGRTALLFHLEK
jgi:hypothetical protein